MASTVQRAQGRVRRLGHRAGVAGHRVLGRWPRRVACPVCGWAGARFAADHHGRRDRICPRCGSSERDRALALELRSRGPVPVGTRLLEVAPIGLVQPLAAELGYQHHSVDLHSSLATVQGDLCSLPFADARFDLVVCFHVLEHVADDRVAAGELARVLRPAGEALVVVPVNRSRTVTFEDPSTPPEDRARVYGQSDHVRSYGADVSARWRGAGITLVESAWADRFSEEDRMRARTTGHDDRFWVIHPA